MDIVTQSISRFASSLTFADLSRETAHAATQRLVDSLGCALGATDCEPANIGRRLAAGQSPSHNPGRVLFSREIMPAESATFINAAMIRNLDFNDRYPGGHPSDCLGALLAVAGAGTTDGKKFLTAMVVIYEIFARISDSAKLSRRGWDQGYAIAISTASGLSNLFGLSQEDAAHAIGIAATSNLPLRVTRSGELTSWKNVATAYASRNGVFAALLAKEGMVSPGNAFAGRHGLFQNVTGEFELEAFPNAGGPALTPRVQLKYWPVETNGQPVVWAALELRKIARAQDIAEIEVFTSKFTAFEIGSEPEKWDPQTHETADHSLPYMFARTLVDGPLTVASFSHDAVLDRALRPIMNMIKVTIDEAIEALLPQMRMRVVATMKDGSKKTIQVENPLGHPDNPMNDGDISEKFRLLGEPVLGAARTKAVCERWWQVAEAGKISDLMDLVVLG